MCIQNNVSYQNDSTNLTFAVSVNESTARFYTRIHGSTTENLYTVHRTLIFIENVTVECLR